jgi:hypothetical protein
MFSIRNRASLHPGVKTSMTDGGLAIVVMTVDIAIVVVRLVVYSVVVVSGIKTVVSPSSPITTVEVEVVVAVVVDVVVMGRTTVKSPDGDPDAIFLVAVRMNVVVTVVTVTQSAGNNVPPAVGIGAVGWSDGAMRHEQAELMKSVLYGASPTLANQKYEDT